jgi:hypothetical protein
MLSISREKPDFMFLASEEEFAVHSCLVANSPLYQQHQETFPGISRLELSFSSALVSEFISWLYREIKVHLRLFNLLDYFGILNSTNKKWMSENADWKSLRDCIGKLSKYEISSTYRKHFGYGAQELCCFLIAYIFTQDPISPGFSYNVEEFHFYKLAYWELKQFPDSTESEIPSEIHEVYVPVFAILTKRLPQSYVDSFAKLCHNYDFNAEERAEMFLQLIS